METFKLAIYAHTTAFEDPVFTETMFRYIDHAVKNKKTNASIIIQLASSGTFAPPVLTKYCSKRSFKLQNNAALNDINNQFRSECLAITCDAAIFFSLSILNEHNQELAVAGECFKYWNKPYKLMEIEKYLDQKET
ncbi:hypothetical protein F7U66_00635 [Vibrio parahaemolyticus]|nr:hypothetical protein [Vibrio parahaemolyticus]